MINKDRQDNFNSDVWYSEISVFLFVDVLLILCSI